MQILALSNPKRAYSQIFAGTGLPIPAATFAASSPAGPGRTGFADHQSPAEELLAVENQHRSYGFFMVANLDEAKTTRLAGMAVADDVDITHAKSLLPTPLPQVFFACAEGQVAHVESLHQRALFIPPRPCAGGTQG